MKNAFETIRYSSPVFVYITSLFILINFFGRFCTTVVSEIAFLFFSILITLILSSKKFTAIIKNSHNKSIISVCCVITVLFSYALESGTVTAVFNVISDAEYKTLDKIWFSIIITGVSVLLCSFGTTTLNKLSNILFILPFIILIPCGLSCLTNGVSYKGFIPTDLSDIFSEIASGGLLSLIYVSDIIIVRDFDKEEVSPRGNNSKFGSILSILFIFILGTLLRFLFGEPLFFGLSAPVFSASSTVNTVEFDEIILIIYSICLLYRFSLKLAFIANFFKGYFNSKKTWLSLSFLVSFLCGISGVLVTQKLRSFILMASLSGILNLIAFIILPYAFSIFKTNENMNDTP